MLVVEQDECGRQRHGPGRASHEEAGPGPSSAFSPRTSDTHVHLLACIYIVAYFVDVAATVQQRLAVISEPNRFRIVELLKDGPRSVGGIVDELGLGQPQVSRHLRLLAEAGVVEVTKRAQQRIYRLHPDAMHVISDWVQGFAALWAERMDRLGALLDDDRAPEQNP